MEAGFELAGLTVSDTCPVRRDSNLATNRKTRNGLEDLRSR